MATTVSKLMTRKLFTVRPDDPVETAVQRLRERGVRHLLVLGDGELVGIISDRDIKRALDPAKNKSKLLAVGGLFFLLKPILVREIMTSDPVCIRPELSVQEAASVMVAERFGALPVVRGSKLVGIITETDLLRYFSRPDSSKASNQSAPASKDGRHTQNQEAKENQMSQTSLPESLMRAHTALMNDLRRLEEGIRPDAGIGLAQLRARLGATHAHITDHFRFEEQNGYMDAVRKREPRLEQTIQELGQEHQRLRQSLDGIIAQTRTATSVDGTLCKEIQEWINRICQHEARENDLVQEAFNMDIGAED